MALIGIILATGAWDKSHFYSCRRLCNSNIKDCTLSKVTFDFLRFPSLHRSEETMAFLVSGNNQVYLQLQGMTDEGYAKVKLFSRKDEDYPVS
jgi:hypothetical protein